MNGMPQLGFAALIWAIRRWILRQRRPTMAMPATAVPEDLDDAEYVARARAANYAWYILLSNGLASPNRAEADAEAWELGRRLRELYVSHRNRAGQR